MNIYSAEKIRDWDRYTIQHTPIQSLDLMERAAYKCFYWITKNIEHSCVFHVFCGTGNNGGDGLVIARYLKEYGYRVCVHLVWYSNEGSADFKANLERLQAIDAEIYHHREAQKHESFEVASRDVIIDAIFGSGLNRAPDGIARQVIGEINKSNVLVISIDIPSGLFCGYNSEENLQLAIKADVTLTFQCPKLSFLLPASGERVGYFEILDIGLLPEYELEVGTEYKFLDSERIVSILKERKKFSHKGSYGHAVIHAGAKGMAGAAVLASSAALKTGVGLITVRTCEENRAIVQTSVPEAMYSDINSSTPKLFQPNITHAIGPGLGTEEQSVKFFQDLLSVVDAPIVIDADAINILSQNRDLLTDLPQGSILTPHPKEFERLVGTWSSEKEKTELLLSFCEKYKVNVVLKGAHTCIATTEGELHFNSTGNSALATGGSGDVLTGMVVGFLSQAYTPIEAAQLAVYMHGLSADIGILEITPESFTSSDIINYISHAFELIE